MILIYPSSKSVSLFISKFSIFEAYFIAMYKCIAPFFVLLFSLTIGAQELYLPRNVKKAIAQETRTLTGNPGKNYWQNGAHYAIDFKVDPETKVVSGSEHIRYFNRAPDSLKTIVIRFVNNVHQPTSPRSGKVSKDFLTDGLKVKSLTVNGEKYELKSDRWETFYSLKLNAALLPNSENNVAIEWEYPLSKESGREGMISGDTFFCAYAYPRISVYDDYNGWDMLPHLGRGEFYNDFSTYDISVAVPKNFMVYATGVLKNPEEVLQPKILERFKKSLTTDQIISIADDMEVKNQKVTLQNAWNTWKFSAENTTDFTFGISSSYVWDASSVQLKSKKVSVQAAYQAGAKDFEKYVQWEKFAVKWFSENLPGVEYPFPTMTAFQGFADMEYPMMVNDNSEPNNLADSRLTADHEIAHTWFPFMMGINETRYAFMDEGWATFFEYQIGEVENGKEMNDEMFKDFRVKRYISDPSQEQDQPIIALSSQVSGVGYGNNAYVKPALAYLALKDLLGDELFKKALHHYIITWQGKHPIPWDFFYSINAGSGKNLDWFWNNWFFSNHYIDLKINSAKVIGKNVVLTIENVGGFAIPFNVNLTDTTGKIRSQHFTPAVWKDKQSTIKITIPASGTVRSVQLDGGVFMDYTPKDNWVNL